MATKKKATKPQKKKYQSPSVVELTGDAKVGRTVESVSLTALKDGTRIMCGSWNKVQPPTQRSKFKAKVKLNRAAKSARLVGPATLADGTRIQMSWVKILDN